MTAAIVRSESTGDYYRAALDASLEVLALSNALPVDEITDHESGIPDWGYFDDATFYPTFGPDDGPWPNGPFVVVHAY